MSVDTRTSLLESAERAARSRGFDGFSYADLAREVGIRKASIHHHFPAKADLATHLMQRYHDGMEAACREIDHTTASGGARLAALVEVYAQALGDGKCLCLCVALSSSRDSLPAEVIACITRFRAMMTDWLHGVFAAGMAEGSIAWVDDPKAEAAAALSLLEGAQLAARAEENMARFDAATRLLRSRIG